MATKKPKKHVKAIPTEINDYDSFNTSSFINTSKPLTLESIGFKLPETPAKVFLKRMIRGVE